MNHPFDKWKKLELIALLLVILIGVAAMVRGVFLLMLLGLYGIAASLLFNGLAASSIHQQIHAIKQFTRGVMLFILATILAMAI